MAATILHKVLRDMRDRADSREGWTDGELLRAYLHDLDQVAFAAILRRHGGMVLQVCRRVLKENSDIEDAFQATFLVLLRKANSLAGRATLGDWLHGVAYHTALKARAMNRNRQTKELKAAQQPKSEPRHEELQQICACLDEELVALPEIYRRVVVLCDFESRSLHEVSQQLGCPQGTVASRLSRGRNLLAKRLTRRGIGVTAGAIAGLVASSAAQAGVPANLAALTMQLANTSKAAVASANVLELSQGVLKMLFLQKIRVFAFAGVATLFLGWSALTFAPTNEVSAQQETGAAGAQAVLDSLWADLASPDEGKATRAALTMATMSKETIGFLRDHLKPVKVDAKRVEQLLKGLNSQTFAVRNQASVELEYFGKYIKTDLEEALKQETGQETKMRIKQLLDKIPQPLKAPPMPPRPGASVSVRTINGKTIIYIDGQPLDFEKLAVPPPPPGPPAHWVRAVRAISVLEHLGTPDAREILQAMANGESDALPTVAAMTALSRKK